MNHRLTAVALCLFLTPLAARGQTAGIQSEVETRLWLQRQLDWLAAVTGLPPTTSLLLVLLLLLILAAVLFLWLARRSTVK